MDERGYHSDDDSVGEKGVEDVQLGFIEDRKNELFQNFDWNLWDGGKVGGFPVWLDPLNIPNSKQLQCEKCHEQLTFLLQIYCPLDDVDSAFHRSLYLFCCKRKSCIENECVKCFRSQLPEVNPFYCGDASGNNGDVKLPNLCQLCGCLANSSCSSCKSVHYCSRGHQKEHWKDHKAHCKQLSQQSQQTTTTPSFTHVTIQTAGPTELSQRNYVFPEYDIVVEPEELDSDEVELMKNVKVMEKATIWDDAETKGGEDEASDAALTQTDYNKALGGEKHDPVYINFLTRIQAGGGDQVLRYNRWDTATATTAATTAVEKGATENSEASTLQLPAHGPLLLSHDAALLRRIQSVPNCERCGAHRAFEFQVMPQLLHFLQVDKKTVVVAADAGTDADPGAVPDGTSDPSSLPPVPPAEEGGESTTEGEQPPPPLAPEVVQGSFQNKSDRDIDWGSIDVYTCTASCCAGDGDSKDNYQSEYVIIQPPPVVYRSTAKKML